MRKSSGKTGRAVKALLDTNILVDYLLGFKQAKEELDNYTEPAISLITWMEVLVGAKGEAEDRLVRDFLRRFILLDLSTDVAEDAVSLRRDRGIRLPDAIIWATARVHDRLLVTRNTRDFPDTDPGVRVPYQI